MDMIVIILPLGSKITPRQETVHFMQPASGPNENHWGRMLNMCSFHNHYYPQALEGRSSGFSSKPGFSAQLHQLPDV